MWRLRAPGSLSSVSGVRPAVTRIGACARAALMMPPSALAVPTITWTITTCGRPVTMAKPWAIPIAVISCGTVSGRGSTLPSAMRLAYASMSGAKSVPAFAKKYSTPRAASSSRYASAALSTATFFSIGLPPLSESELQQPARVARVNRGLLLRGRPHALHGLDGVADEAGALLGVEGHVGTEQDMVGADEGQAAFHGVPGPEQRGVPVEHLEVVDRALLQATERRHVVGIVGPAAELVEAAAHAPGAERDHGAHVVRDDLEGGMAVEEAGEDQPRHCCRRLVGPAERPPDVEARARLPRVIGEAGRPRGMHPDRQVALGHAREDRPVLRQIERAPGDV